MSASRLGRSAPREAPLFGRQLVVRAQQARPPRLPTRENTAASVRRARTLRSPNVIPPLPLGEGRGEGARRMTFALTLTLSQRERGQTQKRTKLLAQQFRHRAVIADEVLWAAREVGELRCCRVDSQPLIQRGEDVAEMNGSRLRLFAPPRRRAKHLS